MSFVVKAAFASIEPRPAHDQMMQFASRRTVVGLQFAKTLRVGFSTEILADSKCWVLRENYFFNWSARLLQKGIHVVPERAAEKNKNYMRTLTARGNWNIAKGKVKQKLAQLADDDLQFIEGKEDELIGRIQKRASQAGKKIEDAVRECSSCRH